MNLVGQDWNMLVGAARTSTTDQSAGLEPQVRDPRAAGFSRKALR